MSLCNAELEEVVNIMTCARKRVVRCHGEGMQGLDPECSNHDKNSKKAGWKDSMYYIEEKPAKAAKAGHAKPHMAKSGFQALMAPPQTQTQPTLALPWHGPALQPPPPRRAKRPRREIKPLGTKLGEWELVHKDGQLLLQSETADKYAVVTDTAISQPVPSFGILDGKYFIVYTTSTGP